MGDKIRFYEKTYDFVILLAFNTGKKPFDDARVRRALSLAIDRRAAAVSLAKVSSMTFAGATQRPESPWAASEAELAALPGFGTDIAAARAEARRLLKEAGHETLKLKLVNRNITNPYTSAGIYIVDQWRQIGVTAEHAQVDVSALMTAMREAQFDAIIDFGGEWVDDPSVVLGRYQSSDVSSYAASRFTDRKVDEMYKVIDTTFDPVARKKVLRELETHVMSEANLVPFLWLNRIVGLASQVRGFRITPTHFVNQDLADIWLAE
jgi:peptide/nickel transport system substrate-binding protein